jgi:hypothetical protein
MSQQHFRTFLTTSLSALLTIALLITVLPLTSTYAAADTDLAITKPTREGISIIEPEELSGTVGILYTDKKSIDLKGWAVGKGIVKVSAVRSDGKVTKEFNLLANGLFTGKLDVYLNGHYVVTAEDKDGNMLKSAYILYVRQTDKLGPKLTIAATSTIVKDKATIAGTAIDTEPFTPVKLQVLKDTFVLAETKVDKNGKFSMTFPIGHSSDVALTVVATDALGNKTTKEWTFTASK